MQPPSPRAASVDGPPSSGDSGDPAAWPRFENYVVSGEQGRGGLGRVLRAHDRRLGRAVALKELLHVSEEARARFVREARLTARLQHPSIVPVYEVGQGADGAPFYAMKLIAGEPLELRIAKARSLDERLALLPSVLAVAEAVAYAHDHGIVHRDLKPQNVICGAFGETVVIDWGLAKDLTEDPALVPTIDETVASVPPSAGLADTMLAAGDDARGLTMPGRAVGTLAYMPPEQFRGERVDERADVFALGAILYATITGAPPYGEGQLASVADQIANAVPRPIAEREPGAPEELVAVVRKAMAAEPAGRYRNAKELVVDLRRFQTGQLVSAHRYGAGILVRRWLARHRRGVATAVAFVVALGALGGVSVRRVVRERDRAEAQSVLARTERARADTRALELTMVQAKTSLDRDPTAALAWLKKYPTDGEQAALAASIAGDASSRGVARHVLRGHRGDVQRVAWSHDGRYVASGGDSYAVRLWDAREGRSVAEFREPSTSAALAFSADDRWLVSGEFDGTMLVVDVPRASARFVKTHPSKIRDVAFAPRGAVLAAGGEDGTVSLFDVDAGVEHARLLVKQTAPITSVEFSPDGARLAAVGDDGTMRVFDVASGAARAYAVSGDGAARVRFSPDGKLLATIESPLLRLTDVETGRSRVLAGHDGVIQGIAFSPDGRELASAGRDKMLHLWDVASGRGRALLGHTEVAESVAYSPDGARIVTTSEDTTARIWDRANGHAKVLRGHAADVYNCAFSPDGTRLATGSADRTVRIWETPPPREKILVGHEHDIISVAFSADGRAVASAAQDNTVRVWDRATGVGQVLTGHTDMAYVVRFLGDDGAKVASGSWDHTVRVWDRATGASKVFTHDGPLRALASTRDARVLFSASQDGTARAWDLVKGESMLVMRGHDGIVRNLALSRDEKLLVTSGADSTVRVWDAATGAPRHVLRGHGGKVNSAVFSPDGTRIASTSDDRTVRIWNVTDGSLVRTFTGHTETVYYVAYSPDGAQIASAGNDGTVRVFTVDGSREPLVLEGHDANVRDVAYSPDGAWLATVANDATLRIWDPRAGRLRGVYRADGPITSAMFSPKGDAIVTGGWDKTVRIWPIGEGGMLPASPADLHAWLDQATTATVDDRGTLGAP